MNKEEIKYIKTENGYKVSMPLITDDELEKIDFNFHSIVDDYIKEFSNKREKTIEQRLIYDLQQENKQLKEQLGKLLGLNEDELWLEYNKEVLNLQKENELLKDNWNKLKEFAQELFDNPSWASCGARYILEKMQELENGDIDGIKS